MNLTRIGHEMDDDPATAQRADMATVCIRALCGRKNVKPKESVS